MKITRSLLYQLFFSFCVIIPFFNNYELSFLFWIFALILTIRNKYSNQFIFYLSHFVLILLIAFIVGFFFNYNKYFIIRDITYMLKPILGLIIGYQFFHKNIRNPFLFLLNAGLLMAIIHLFLVGYGVIFEGARNVREIREHGGYFNDYEIYTLIILIFKNTFNIQISRKKYILYLSILALSSFFYLARTNFIQFVILFIAIKGWLILNVKSVKLISLSIISISLIYTAIYFYNPKRNGQGIDEFLFKVKNSPIEAFSTKINRDDWKDFNDNYRSYENIRTLEQLSHNKTYIFGEGMGSQVDLKQKVYLGDMELRHISILHNGYMTVILKSGIIGLIILLGSIFYLFKKTKTDSEIVKNINYLFIGTGVFLIFSNWVFMGFYNPVDTKSLLIGFLFAFKIYLTKENKKVI